MEKEKQLDDDANFNPSTSVNQLEFWQEDTYDPKTIEELNGVQN